MLFLYLLYIRFHRSSCLDGWVLFSGRKSSSRICSILIVPSLFPGPESAETIVYRQAARNRRKAVIVTRLRCLLVRRRQNSRIRPSARLRLASDDWRADNRRRHPRSHHPQRPPHRTEGRQHAPKKQKPRIDPNRKSRNLHRRSMTADQGPAVAKLSGTY